MKSFIRLAVSIPRRKSSNYKVNSHFRECVFQMSVVFLLIAIFSIGSAYRIESIRTLKHFFPKAKPMARCGERE